MGSIPLLKYEPRSAKCFHGMATNCSQEQKQRQSNHKSANDIGQTRNNCVTSPAYSLKMPFKQKPNNTSQLSPCLMYECRLRQRSSIHEQIMGQYGPQLSIHSLSLRWSYPFGESSLVSLADSPCGFGSAMHDALNAGSLRTQSQRLGSWHAVLGRFLSSAAWVWK